MLERALDSPDYLNDSISPEESQVIQGKIAAIRSHMASREGKIQGTEQLIEKAYSLLPENEHACRSVVALSSGIVNNIKGDYATALHDHSYAMSEALNAGNTYLFLIARLWKILDLKNTGRLPEAVTLCRRLIKEMESNELSFLVAKGHVSGTWGELLYEMNRLEEAEQFQEKGVNFLKQGYDANHLGWRLTILFNIRCSRRKIKAAQQLLPEMDDLMDTVFISPWIETHMRTAKAKIWLMQGNKTALLQWISDCGLKVDGEYTILHEAENIMHARILLDQDRLDDALEVTSRLIDVQEKASRVLNQIETLIIRSFILKKMQKGPDSIDSLVRALTLAQPGGYLRIFIDEGRPLAEMIEAITDFGKTSVTKFAKKLLVEFKTIKHVIGPVNLIEPLSDRELEVLRLICAGLSNKKVTDELFISMNTVKTHLKNIYGKLSVHSRAEAILKAQELELL